MLKETNLDGVKSVARMLLLTPVHKTPYSPAVVQHPFASSGLVGITREGMLYVLDITEGEENLKQWHEFMKSKIEGAENVWGIYAFINKPYGLTFLKFAEPHLSKEEFSKLLADAWVRSENPNDDPNFTKRDLIAMFKRADKQALMTEEDYKRWQDLEKSITVYRGVTPHNEKNIRALSWTLDAEKAEWFAMRFGENGKVYQAEIDKKDVYAYFGGRGESEVIVEPEGLRDITLVEEIEQTIKYVFYGESVAGNSTGYYTIIIDRTIKTLEVQNVVDGSTDGNVVITWTDGNPEQFAPVKSVLINGNPYTKGQTIYTIDTGKYYVTSIDEAGNVWDTEFVSTKQNVLTKTLQQEYYEIHDAEGNYFSFASYDSAFAFAVEREKTDVRTGEWNSTSWDTGIAMDAKDSVNAVNGTYFIYKKSGNPEEEVAYFTEKRLNEVIAEYAAIGINDYYYWEKEPATIADGENLFSYSDAKTILANSVTFDGTVAHFVDGEEYVDTVYETNGFHTLTVADEWGNTCEYNLTIVRNAPIIGYVVGEGEGATNTVTFDRTYYVYRFNGKIIWRHF